MSPASWEDLQPRCGCRARGKGAIWNKTRKELERKDGIWDWGHKRPTVKSSGSSKILPPNQSSITALTWLLVTLWLSDVPDALCSATLPGSCRLPPTAPFPVSVHLLFHFHLFLLLLFFSSTVVFPKEPCLFRMCPKWDSFGLVVCASSDVSGLICLLARINNTCQICKVTHKTYFIHL